MLLYIPNRLRQFSIYLDNGRIGLLVYPILRTIIVQLSTPSETDCTEHDSENQLTFIRILNIIRTVHFQQYKKRNVVMNNNEIVKRILSHYELNRITIVINYNNRINLDIFIILNIENRERQTLK